MPLLQRSKKRRDLLRDKPPWEKEPGYWEAPYGRLAMDWKYAGKIAETHPDVAYHTPRMHDAEQFAAAKARELFKAPLSCPTAHPSNSEFHQSARRFAEACPNILNRYAQCESSSGIVGRREPGRYCETCRPRDSYRMHEMMNSGLHNYQRDYYEANQQHRNQIFEGVPHESMHQYRPFCSGCLPASPTGSFNGYSPFPAPVLMRTTYAPGRDGRFHHENCPQAQPEPYCRCRDYDDRRRRLMRSPDGSYVRERLRDGVGEV